MVGCLEIVLQLMYFLAFFFFKHLVLSAFLALWCRGLWYFTSLLRGKLRGKVRRALWFPFLAVFAILSFC